MEEQLITFETAKLAKDKGFNEPCQFVYIEGRRAIPHNNRNISNRNECYSMSTQSLLQRWIRDTHSISVNITHRPHSQSYGFYITGKYNEGNQGVLKSYDFKSYESYEEALEQGLTEALNLIQK